MGTVVVPKHSDRRVETLVRLEGYALGAWSFVHHLDLKNVANRGEVSCFLCQMQPPTPDVYNRAL